MPSTTVNDYLRIRALSRFTALYPGALKHIFVHSVTGGTGSAYGETPDAPLSTLDAAFGDLCTAGRGDVIHVLPGHTETITTAAGIAIDKSGVTVVGYGNGRNRPTITFGTGTAASLDISAANVTLQNLALVNAIDAQTAMVNVSAADVTIRGCEVQLGDTSTQAALGILTTAAANRLTVEDCHLHGMSTAGVTGAIRLVGGDSAVIQNNRIVGAFAVTGAIENVTTALTNAIIAGNYILNQTADGDNKVIVLHASATAIITNNRGGIIDSTSPAPVTAAAAWVANNHWSSAVGIAPSTAM